MEENLAILSMYLLAHKFQFSKSQKHCENMKILLIAEIRVTTKTEIISAMCVITKTRMIKYP